MFFGCRCKVNIKKNPGLLLLFFVCFSYWVLLVVLEFLEPTVNVIGFCRKALDSLNLQ